MFAGIAQPQSSGTIRLTGANPHDALDIRTNALTHESDIKAAMAAIRLAREIGNAQPLRSLLKREAIPGTLTQTDLFEFIKNAAVTFWHETCTCKMRRDAMLVVDGSLAVYGMTGLRIADGSIMPRITTANTMGISHLFVFDACVRSRKGSRDPYEGSL
jgi:choline dehydrogenase